MIQDPTAGNSSDKFLVYQLGGEQYATPLIEVREVIEYRSAKPIPHTAPYFKGVINIRGEIIGVIDLRERLGVEGSPKPLAQLIFETDNGSLAAIVDRVHAVSVIAESDLERRPSVQGSTERAYFLGVGKVEGQLMTVLSLKKILTGDQMVDLPTQGT